MPPTEIKIITGSCKWRTYLPLFLFTYEGFFGSRAIMKGKLDHSRWHWFGCVHRGRSICSRSILFFLFFLLLPSRFRACGLRGYLSIKSQLGVSIGQQATG